MNVKAQGLLNAAKYIEETFGRDALGEVIRACSAGVRETYTSATVINWHPVEQLCEFCDVAERKLGTGHPRFVEDIGAAGAKANMKGTLLRLAFYWGKPEFLMQRAAGLWRQFNDEGTMVLLEMTDRIVRFEVSGVKEPRVTFCRLITGWCDETAKALGMLNVIATHAQCRAQGGPRCLYEVRGRVDPSDAKMNRR
jgi:hypothetical protein